MEGEKLQETGQHFTETFMRNSESSQRELPRAVILTALPVEYEAVCSHLTELQEDEHPEGTIYSAVFAGKSATWEVGVVNTSKMFYPC